MPLCRKSITIAVGVTILSSLIAYSIAYVLLIKDDVSTNIFLVVGGIWMMAIFYIFERLIPYLNGLKLKSVKNDTTLESQY